MALVIDNIPRKRKSYKTYQGFSGYGSYAECGLIKKGARGTCVTKLQSLLMQKGYSLPLYGADGNFGFETETAVRAFQRDKGLSADGQVGLNTWAALIGEAVPTPIPTPWPGTTPAPIPSPVSTPIDLKKYLPYILIGGGLLIITIYLLKRK